MKGRLAGLVVLALCELLAGLGLRNEVLASRSRIEQYRRDVLVLEDYRAHYEYLRCSLSTPEALRVRLQWRRELADQVQRLPEL